MRGVVGHMRHSSRVLQCCYPERSSCDHEFGCRYPYNTHLEHFDFLFVMWKNLRVFMNLNSAGKLQEKLLNWTCQAFFLFNQSDYLNQTGSWYAYWSVLYECIEHADDTDVRFWNQGLFWRLKLMPEEFNGFFRKEKKVFPPILLACSSRFLSA